MHNASHNDLRPFFKAHPQKGPKDHRVQIVAGAQIHLICIDCGFSVTQDAVDAGLPVVHTEGQS